METKQQTPLSADNFDNWLNAATIEHDDEGGWRVLTDYDNMVEVKENGDFISPFEMDDTKQQRIFDMIEEHNYEADYSDCPDNDEHGLYCYGY